MSEDVVTLESQWQLGVVAALKFDVDDPGLGLLDP
jgi:hypothetical protein